MKIILQKALLPDENRVGFKQVKEPGQSPKENGMNDEELRAADNFQELARREEKHRGARMLLAGSTEPSPKGLWDAVNLLNLHHWHDHDLTGADVYRSACDQANIDSYPEGVEEFEEAHYPENVAKADETVEGGYGFEEFEDGSPPVYVTSGSPLPRLLIHDAKGITLITDNESRQLVSPERYQMDAAIALMDFLHEDGPIMEQIAFPGIAKRLFPILLDGPHDEGDKS